MDRSGIRVVGFYMARTPFANKGLGIKNLSLVIMEQGREILPA